MGAKSLSLRMLMTNFFHSLVNKVLNCDYGHGYGFYTKTLMLQLQLFCGCRLQFKNLLLNTIQNLMLSPLKLGSLTISGASMRFHLIIKSISKIVLKKFVISIFHLVNVTDTVKNLKQKM